MKSTALFILFVTFLAGPTVVQAVSVQSTTSTYVSLRQCVAGETVCDSIDRSHRRAVDGMPGSRDAQASLKDPEFGEATGSAQLTGEPGSAKISASANSLPAKRNASTGYVTQRYTNSSDRRQTLTFTGDLTYDQTVPDENSKFPADGGGRTGAFVEMELFSLETDSIEAGTSAEENFEVFMEGPPPGYQTLDGARTDGTMSNVTGQGNEEFSMSAVLEAGDSLWMFVLLQAISANGAVVEATLDTELTIVAE
jgi:hypothetical protein